MVAKYVMAVLLSVSALGAFAQEKIKVVYHINDAAAQAIGGLRNAKNQLDTDPNTEMTIVTHAAGVAFLMNDAKDRNGNAYDNLVRDLVKRGVKFEVCEITLKNRDLKKTQFIPEAGFTPSGVVRISQLQFRERYAYVKP